ncbi:MAG: hypothetical protein K2I56_08615 [Muribaculaceae bacterium]|nr:hypothetical protein [Muribaculaceae bacterium]
MRKLILSLISLLAVAGSMRGAASQPDFAYPQTVISEATKKLAESGGQGHDATLAMLEITVATMSLGNDSVFMLPARIHALAEQQKSPALKSLLLLMQAQTLNSLYNARRYQYDRSDTPDEPLPDDVAQWNGRQFRAQIQSLLNDAYNLACTDPARLDDFSDIVTADRIALLYYPTVRDFIALKATGLNAYDSEPETILLRNSIIEKEIALGSPGSYSQINWLCRQLENMPLDTEVRRARLLELYQRYSDSEASCQLLEEYLNTFNCRNATAEAAGMARAAIDRYPGYWNINALRNSLTELERPWIEFTAPETCIPGKEFEIKVSYGNISDNGSGIIVYRGTSNGYAAVNNSKPRKTEVKRFNVSPKNATPYQAETSFRFTADEEVYYYISPVLTNTANTRRDPVPVLCTSMTPIIINGCTENAAIVADAASGRPLQGVNVRVGRAGQNAVAPVSMGKTDDEGALRFRLPRKLTDKSGRRYLQLVSHGRTNDFGEMISVAPYSRYSNNKKSYTSLILTDRALYHPGDTVRWAATLSSYDPRSDKSELCSGADVRLIMTDVNGQTVADTTLTTDSFGRIAAFSVTSAEGLTGSYSLRAEYNGNNTGYASVEVSDFRMPQFAVRIDSTLRDTPRRGCVTLHGNATTYSMMPVANAEVMAEIKGASRFRWFVPQQTIAYVTATTDASGDFTIELSDSLLRLSALDCYIADVRVTAPGGESRSCSASFTTGKQFEIVLAESSVNCADSVAIPATVYNADGLRQNTPIRWNLTYNGRDLASGSASAPAYMADWTDVPSGDYTLNVWTADTALADTASCPISLYNTRLGTMSAARPLFVPKKSLSIAHGHSGELLYGVPEDTYLYMTLGVDSLLVSVEGLETSAGFHRMKLTLPEGYEQGRLTLHAVKDGIVYTENIAVSEKVDRTIGIEGESFRDRIAPGDREHWRLRLTSPESRSHLASAVVATAYNKALSALTQLSWPSGFTRPGNWTSINYGTYANMAWIKTTERMSASVKELPPAYLQSPELRYPIVLHSMGNIMIRGGMHRKAANGLVQEYAEERVYMSAATTDMAAVESAENNTAEEEAADAGTGGENSTENNGAALDSYRPSEVLQALWMPSLTSDSQGNVDIEFTVPEANTTWTFQAFAWDDRLNSGTFVRDVVSQKPVMVQPNLPRFLRAGDSAVILATVYNNTATADTIHTVAETFDISSGKVLSTSMVNRLVGAGGSEIVSLSVTAPSDASLVGYRVRSTLGRFTDGEQAALPVLPASTEVIESQIFSLTANTAEVSVKLPKSDKMQLALEFCSNPAWDVIKALPSLYESKANTSTGAARQLFRAAASAGLIHSDPQIEATLRRALDNKADSSLVSQLEKNDNLKLATLNQTPWVQAAASQTERMARLELLFSKSMVNADINSAIRTLSRLQKADGGWSWGDWDDESSLWATRSVLLTIGQLSSLGYLPDDRRIGQMADRALSYCESQLGDERTDSELAWIYTLLPAHKPGLKAKKVIEATVQEVVGGWRKLGVGAKARAALMLKHYGYANVAAEVMNSIAEFAQTEKDGAIFFPSVNDIDQYSSVLFAWASLEPDAQLIDGIRQWLVMRSQRTDALASCDPTNLIAAFLRSGSRWTVPAELPRISLGDRQLELPQAESMTGHFTMAVDNSTRADRLVINRDNPQTPAWGALFSRYSGRTDRIEAKACDGLSIEKQLSVLRDGKWQYADEIRLGERVRVVLTLKVKDDLQYVTVTDDRAAGLEPVDQLPGYVASAGVRFYRENSDTTTRLFIGWLPRGTYSITYELTANMAGNFISGVASAQSQYTPAVTAHSAGYRLEIMP